MRNPRIFFEYLMSASFVLTLLSEAPPIYRDRLKQLRPNAFYFVA